MQCEYRLQTQEETPREQGDNTHQIQSYTWYHPVFWESLLGFGVSSGEFLDSASASASRATPATLVTLVGRLVWCLGRSSRQAGQWVWGVPTLRARERARSRSRTGTRGSGCWLVQATKPSPRGRRRSLSCPLLASLCSETCGARPRAPTASSLAPCPLEKANGDGLFDDRVGVRPEAPSGFGRSRAARSADEGMRLKHLDEFPPGLSATRLLRGQGSPGKRPVDAGMWARGAKGLAWATTNAGCEAEKLLALSGP